MLSLRQTINARPNGGTITLLGRSSTQIAMFLDKTIKKMPILPTSGSVPNGETITLLSRSSTRIAIYLDNTVQKKDFPPYNWLPIRHSVNQYCLDFPLRTNHCVWGVGKFDPRGPLPLEYDVSNSRSQPLCRSIGIGGIYRNKPSLLTDHSKYINRICPKN